MSSNSSGVRRFVQRNLVVYLLSYGLFLVTYLTLVCCSGVRRKWPGNFILLGVFTLALSYLAGAIASFHDTEIVVMTVGITCAICLCLTLFATQTKVRQNYINILYYFYLDIAMINHVRVVLLINPVTVQYYISPT